jgi:ribosome-binding factor A
VYYTTIGDEKARRESARALDRATPFLRRQIGRRLRLKRVPELPFFFDDTIEKNDRIERILQELNTERAQLSDGSADDPSADAGESPKR